MRIIARLKGETNVKTLSDVRLSLMRASLDLNRFNAGTESEKALLLKVQKTITESCNKLSILEGELTNAGIQ